MLKRILFLVLLLLGLLLLVACGETVQTAVTTTADQAPVTVRFRTDNAAMGRILGPAVQTLNSGKTTASVTALPQEGYEFIGWSDGVTTPTRQKESFSSDTELIAYFRLTYSELPLFSFSMESGNEVTSKTKYTPITLTVSNTDAAFCLTEAEGQLRGRGNATWRMEKKSYRLKLTRKANLLGQSQGAAKDWILLANHCDQTLLRNALAFSLGRAMEGIPYTTSGNFVEVMINGDYKGVYLLCEQVEVQEHRIPVKADPLDPTPGYLVELDRYANEDADALYGTTYFSAGGQYYSIKSDATKEQLQWIAADLAKIDQAIRSGDRATIEALIDLNSCVDMYLIHEFLLNIDVGWSSFYLYKTDGEEKLIFAPVWDFDLAMGNDRRLFSGDPYGLYVGAQLGFTQENQWFTSLCRQTWFNDLVKARFREKQDTFAALSIEARTMADAMETAVLRNFRKWKIFGQKINQEPDQVLALKTYDAHVAHLCTWLEQRYDWLSGQFL